MRRSVLASNADSTSAFSSALPKSRHQAVAVIGLEEDSAPTSTLHAWGVSREAGGDAGGAVEHPPSSINVAIAISDLWFGMGMGIEKFDC
ncbi:hypothetical protein ACINB_28300 [Acidovorax sp. NB1]|nr:hypothetical protein ACINB_28300 [Acidovorax sp. NB1]